MEYYTCIWYKIKIVSLADFYEINIALITTCLPNKLCKMLCEIFHFLILLKEG